MFITASVAGLLKLLFIFTPVPICSGSLNNFKWSPFGVFALFRFPNFQLGSSCCQHYKEMRSFTNKIYPGTAANMNLMSWPDSVLKVTMKGSEVFFLCVFCWVIAFSCLPSISQMLATKTELFSPSWGPFMILQRPWTPDGGWKCLSLGYYLKHDKVSRVLKAWRWWSKHKTWMHCSYVVNGGGSKWIRVWGRGLNGNLPNLLTLLCCKGGHRGGTWLRILLGIIKEQSLDIRHVVQIPPIFTRTLSKPLSQMHKERPPLALWYL